MCGEKADIDFDWFHKYTWLYKHLIILRHWVGVGVVWDSMDSGPKHKQMIQRCYHILNTTRLWTVIGAQYVMF